MNLNYYVGGQLFYNLHHCRNDHALPARVQVSFNFINKQDNCLLSWSTGQPMRFRICSNHVHTSIYASAATRITAADAIVIGTLPYDITSVGISCGPCRCIGSPTSSNSLSEGESVRKHSTSAQTGSHIDLPPTCQRTQSVTRPLHTRSAGIGVRIPFQTSSRDNAMCSARMMPRPVTARSWVARDPRLQMNRRGVRRPRDRQQYLSSVEFPSPADPNRNPRERSVACQPAFRQIPLDEEISRKI